jgi:hypothetical protein
METLKLIASVIVFFLFMIPIYRMAKRNSDYKYNQRYGIPRYDESSRRSERK